MKKAVEVDAYAMCLSAMSILSVIREEMLAKVAIVHDIQPPRLHRIDCMPLLTD